MLHSSPFCATVKAQRGGQGPQRWPELWTHLKTIERMCPIFPPLDLDVTDKQMDGQTDRETNKDGWTDRQTDGPMDRQSGLKRCEDTSKNRNWSNKAFYFAA